MLEALTWARLRIHNKPCILINTLGYWDGLLRFFHTAVAAGFLKPENLNLQLVAANAAEALRMASGL